MRDSCRSTRRNGTKKYAETIATSASRVSPERIAAINLAPLDCHHTDADREFAYDRQSSIGQVDKAPDEAQTKGWTVVDMKRDWKTDFPAAKSERAPCPHSA